ncbi:YciI family protein [Sporosalibacterium faouarense]|uniref:YciI family protein n=1 Tax=Sporosalibacterium faouarense TaxID=516123 RepID=UPI00141C30E9|nr:YciI family protein [Sporosalibacterium faouarense]MTI49168.1 hypothetical protein [Bacillota bacterium]
MILYAAILEMVDPKKDKELLDIHIQYLNEHIEKGNIFAKGPFTDHSGGLVIYKANSYDDAKALVENDPAIVNGTRKFTLKEWKSNIE